MLVDISLSSKHMHTLRILHRQTFQFDLSSADIWNYHGW
ncbi:hypothetical protein Leryth_015481 [Lithospermum erythrorhizon]|nr:hypothetical protein Leryth_015481 [Lithospermum erythrorhizon]